MQVSDSNKKPDTDVLSHKIEILKESGVYCMIYAYECVL